MIHNDFWKTEKVARERDGRDLDQIAPSAAETPEGRRACWAANVHGVANLVRVAAAHRATLVERHSRFVMLIKLADKNSVRVAQALAEKIQQLPKALRRSLAWDRGIEMASHHRFTLATDVQVYFCDPYSPWQRGANENTNGLLRQYFPQGRDLSVYSQAELDAVADRLNGRPRQTLGWQNPAERFAQTVASIG